MLFQGSVSHELVVYLSNFYLFFWLNEMVILSKARKPNNFELHNFLKLGFTNIGGLRSNFAASESFLESNSPDILALWETNLIDSGDFSVKGYLSLIRKDSVTCMHSLAVYVKDRLPFARGFITRKLSGFYLFSTCFTSFPVFIFPPIDHLLCARFLMLIHLT